MIRSWFNTTKEKRHPKNLNHRRSVAMVWTAVTMTVTAGFAALAVDVGYTYSVRAQLQRTADASAMAAASQLMTGDMDKIYAEALKYAQKNKIGNLSPTLAASDVVLGKSTLESSGKTTFSEGETPYDTVKVSVRLTKDSPNGATQLFFGRILGVEEVEMAASAVATLVPRDIVVVIDLSNSMSYDSQLRHETTTEINIKQVWEGLGSPTFGNMKTFHSSASAMPYYARKSYSATQVKNLLGLNSVPYPYAGGSWDDYIKYVNGTGSLKDAKTIDANNSNYSCRYGLRTFVNYLMDCRAQETETPQLADCPVQPVQALKDAVGELCTYLLEMGSGDQVGLVSYSNNANLEEEMTTNFLTIIQTTKAQQAGQKGNSTNIANGMQVARLELLSERARSYAKKVMIVMTDGKANLPSNESYGKLQAINAGHSAVNQNIQIYTISLGTEADQALMAELADLGSGIHFHVPTNDVSQYSEDLKKVFRTLGGKRPVRLIE
jgi:Mg-chelatase subunit ChlD